MRLAEIHAPGTMSAVSNYTVSTWHCAIQPRKLSLKLLVSREEEWDCFDVGHKKQTFSDIQTYNGFLKCQLGKTDD